MHLLILIQTLKFILQTNLFLVTVYKRKCTLRLLNTILLSIIKISLCRKFLLFKIINTIPLSIIKISLCRKFLLFKIINTMQKPSLEIYFIINLSRNDFQRVTRHKQQNLQLVSLNVQFHLTYTTGITTQYIKQYIKQVIVLIQITTGQLRSPIP